MKTTSTTTAATTSVPTTYASNPALLLNQTSSQYALSSGDNGDAIKSVSVHPLVLLSVLDHHTRRQEGAGRVIGTLLGRKDGDRVEITNCFAVPHAERGDEVAIGKDFNRQMLALHLRANPKEIVVGWYATALPDEDDDREENEAVVHDDSKNRTDGHDNPNTTATTTTSTKPRGYKCIADTSSLINEFYAGECDDDDPIHLVVDTSLAENMIYVRAYKSTPVLVKNEVLANMFHEIKLCVKSTESERICVDKMIQSQSLSPLVEKEQQQKQQGGGGEEEDDETSALQVSMERLLTMLETASTFVDNVVNGKTPPNDQIGRQIADALAVVPRVRTEVFEKMFNDSLQDLLMVTYLSNITKTQLAIAEKLNASLGV